MYKKMAGADKKQQFVGQEFMIAQRLVMSLRQKKCALSKREVCKETW